MPEKTRTHTPAENTVQKILERHQEYTNEFRDAQNENNPVKERVYMAMAAACADLMRFYYLEKGEPTAAETWKLRSKRLGDRARRINKNRLKNMGATMP